MIDERDVSTCADDFLYAAEWRRGAKGADYNKMPRSAQVKAVTCYLLPVSRFSNVAPSRPHPFLITIIQILYKNCSTKSLTVFPSNDIV